MMPMNDTLETLTRHRLIWRGRDGDTPQAMAASGQKLLDERLGGGFPAEGVIDVHSPRGIGELRLLLPRLAQPESGQQTSRLWVFIAPPAAVNAESLAAAGLDLSRVLVVRPATAGEALWAAEQSLKSGCCRAVMLWQQAVKTHQAQRLQLAAREGRANLWLFRDNRVTAPLPVSLNLQLSAHPRGLVVTVPKRRGGWPVPAFVLDMRADWPELTLPALPANVIPLPRAKAG
jgi:cell division inhibitor SulA